MIRFIILAVILTVLFLANIFFGAVHIDAGEVIEVLKGDGNGNGNDVIRFIVVGSRFPQAMTAMLAGAGLGVAGLLLQTGFRNPLAGPSVLGISSGASLGVALVMLLFGGTISIGEFSWGGYVAIVAGAIFGSMLIMGILIALSSIVRDNLMLLIAGIMTGYLTSSVVTLLSSMSSAIGIQGYVMWGMGSFSDVSLTQLPWFSMIVALGLVMAMTLAKPLNILLLGDNYARNLGINVTRVRNMMLISTGVLTGVVTAYCGPVAFVGMAIPHVSRIYFRTDNHWVLIPATMLTGAIMTLACNAASTVPENFVIPINALTSLIGVPIILAVILRRK
ncbi:MAG: iron ABC transporter permease [Muribaculaceae bacterium]|nr:iron ABC transporter permease [Muribaculaceae bacterium]MDE6532743.1 iron ABC transporter permease [Muribaculaceae bacterium]MDE6772034.1 iron ABC transporter permease [Muribaculaceae bacterium]